MKIATITNDPGVGVTFAWADGKATTFDRADLPDEMREACFLLGLATKLQNAYAGAVSKGMTIADCRKASGELFSRLQNGEWGAERSGGIWVEAIAKATGQDLAEVAKTYAAMSDEKKAQVRKHPKILKAKLAIETSRIKDEGDEADLSDFE